MTWWLLVCYLDLSVLYLGLCIDCFCSHGELKTITIDKQCNRFSAGKLYYSVCTNDAFQQYYV